MKMNKGTVVLFVDEIEPCLSFWEERLGFEVTGTVPHGDRLGFAMLERDGVEVMYQTPASMADDLPALADTPVGSAFLFVQVDDLDQVQQALAGLDPVVPRRQTFYGMDELVMREPGGNVVTFAQFLEG